VATQPFGHHPGNGKQEWPRDAFGPATAIGHVIGQDHQRRENRESHGQAADREGREPAERFGIDQQSVGDPIEACDEMTEAEPPTGGEGLTAIACRLTEPNQAAERRHQCRKNIERRHGERRQATAKNGNPVAPPTNDRCQSVDQAVKPRLVRNRRV